MRPTFSVLMAPTKPSRLPTEPGQGSRPGLGHDRNPQPDRDRPVYAILRVLDFAGSTATVSRVPKVSVICPTHNREHLWRTHWLWNSIATQTVQPRELVIAIDHTQDNTLDAIHASWQEKPLRCTVRIIQVQKPAATPFPASGQPDNCLFAAADAPLILHVDDDILLAKETIAHVEHIFRHDADPNIWYPMTFVDEDHTPLPRGEDWRLELIARLHLPTLPGGLVTSQVHMGTGAIFAVRTDTIRAIGGHALVNCGHHNQDTLLGFRLKRACKSGSFIVTDPALFAEHLGTTWHMQHRLDKKAMSFAYGQTAPGPTIANAGTKFWSSDWFADAYTEVLTLHP